MSDLIARLRLEATAGNLPAVAGQTRNAVDGVRDAAQRAGPAMAAAEVGTNRFAAGLDRAGDQAQRFETRVGGAGRSLNLLNSLLGGAALGVFVNDITKAAFAVGGLEIGLGAVTGGAAEAQAELAFVRSEAGRLGLVAQTTAKDFMDLAAATNGTALAGRDTREIWLATAEAGMALGRTPEQVGRGLMALQQIASKGVVSMEEVRQQLAEAIPGAVQIASRAMGMSSQAFNELVEKGKLTADVFLPKFAAQLRSEYGPAIENYLTTPLGMARQEIGRMGTSLTDLRAASGEGFLEGVTAGLASLNAELGDGKTADHAREIGLALGQGAALAAEAVAWLVDHVDELQAALTVVMGVGVAQMLISTARAAHETAAAYLAKGGAARASALMAQQGLAAETAALGGVRGAIIQAAAAEVAAAEAVRNGAVMRELAAKASWDQARAELANAASSSTLAQRRAALAVAEAELAAARTATAAATGRLAAAEAGHARSLTAWGQAAGMARGAGSALLGLVGGPWGAAMLAAGGTVMWTVNALKAQEKKFSDVNKSVAAAKAEYDALRAAQKVLGDESGKIITVQDQAAVAAATLTGEVHKLAEAHYLAAAGAKAQMVETLRLKAVERGEDASKAVANFNTRLQGYRGQAHASMAGGGRAAAPGQVADAYEAAAAKALKTEEFEKMVTAGENARFAADSLRAEMARPLASYLVETTTPGAEPKGDGKGKKKRDRVGDMREDLRLEEAALKAHALAAVAGERALDAWRIADAGAQAVARAGLKDTDAAAQAIREQAEAVERLAIADERIEEAAAFARSALNDTDAMKRRAEAAAGGRAALEQLRITEAGLAVLSRARIDSLDELDGLEREAVQTALDAATAREHQAIATEKAEAAGKTVEELDRQITAEGRRQAAIGRGIEAEVAYARAEFVRQEVERNGLELTDAAAQAIIEKAEALFRLQAITDGSQAAADAERELRLMRLSNREREIAVRAETILSRLAAERLELTEQERAALADRAARAELEAEETAAAIGRITGSLRDGFVRDGKLGMDQVGAYAEERLRAALYDAWLAKPIDIIVNATVSIANDMAKQIFGGDAAKGFLGDLLGGLKLGGIGNTIGQAGVGMAIGQSMGLGSGNGWMDAGLSLGGQMLGSWASGAVASAVGGSMGAALGSIMGPLGALAGVALGSLLKDKKRPYTRADIVAQGGQWTVAGSEAVDGAGKEVADQLGKAITESLNAASALFGIDVAKLEGLYTTAGYVEGGNYKALGGKGFFGGDIRGAIDYYNQAGRDKKGNTLGVGVSFSQVGSAEELATQVVRETILRAIAAGASDLSDAEVALVQAASSLEEAIALIGSARGFGVKIDDMLLKLLDPAEYERKMALDQVEATYNALRAEAEQLIDAGLMTADVLAKIERLRDLQRDAALNGLAGGSANPFAEARDRLQSWLDSVAVSDLSGGGPRQQRAAAEEQYDRVLALAKAGDRDALADLATYADRLLRADRVATGSAMERQKLYDQVTGDVRDLIGQASLGEDLTAAAISGPIIAALAQSQTALSDVLMTLPPEMAAPLLAAILREPDWATLLLGENVQVPPELRALRDQVMAVAPEAAGPIVAAVLATPVWTEAMNAHLASVPMSIETVRAALAGLPEGIAGPILGVLVQSQGWEQASVEYLKSVPPSLELLAGVLAGQPPEISGPIVEAILRDPVWAGSLLDQMIALGADLPAAAAPIIAALLQTPEWGAATAAYLQSLPPSLALLTQLLDGQPSQISGPIVEALLRTPEWAILMISYLAGLGAGGGEGAGAGMANAILDPLSRLVGLSTEGHGGGSRPYTRADIVAQGGQWTVAGIEAADGGSRAVANQLGASITQALNAASAMFGIDVSKLEGLYTTAGYVTGKNFKALGGQGFFGGDINGAVDYYHQAGRDKKGNTVGSGVSYSQVGSAEQLAEQVVRETILRAIAAGASDLSARDAALVAATGTLEEAVALITYLRNSVAENSIATVPQPPIITGGIYSGGATSEDVSSTTRAVEALTLTFEARFTALQNGLQNALSLVADATAQGLEGVTGVSVRQLQAIENLASAQRVANAHVIAKAAY